MQIRIQLAHRGFPLLGDLLYQAVYAAPESDQQSQEAPSSPATFAAAAASGVEQAEPAQLLEEARPIKHPRMHPWQPASSVDMLQAGSSAQADSTREVACQGSFVVQVGQHAPLQTHIPLTPASCAPNEGGGARSAAAGLSPLAAKDRSLEAQRIFREHQDNPLKPVALQVCIQPYSVPCIACKSVYVLVWHFRIRSNLPTCLEGWP